jgi:hypothetical protein
MSTTYLPLTKERVVAGGTLFGKPRSQVIKHPGALTKAAKKHGVSKLQEAEKESHSSDPSIRARGNLGKRFIQHKL